MIIDCKDVTTLQYKIGDLVSFADTNWIVLKESKYSDDYVTLLKEDILKNNEMGSYALKDGSNVLPFYYSSTCHLAHYGETKYEMDGCKNHNDYQGCYIKDFLENYYLSKLEQHGKLVPIMIKLLYSLAKFMMYMAFVQ